MARTRTQQIAAAKAAARASSLSKASRPGQSQRRPDPEQHRPRSQSKVQFSSVVQVKELAGDDGSPSNGASAEPAARKGSASAQRTTKAAKLPASRQRPNTNVHTFANLPSPISTASGISSHSPRGVPVSSVRRHNIVTLNDLPRTTHRGTGGSTQATGLRSPPQTNESASVPSPDSQKQRTGSRSSLLTDLSPTSATSRKRPRKDSSDFYQPQPKRQQFEYDAKTDLQSDLRRTPRALAPEEISALFQVLRDELHEFAFDHFSFELTPQAQADWPLQDMEDRYFPLMLTAQYIADGSQYGWRHFFTTPDSRASLVYGIIAEYLRNHVFSMPAFGFSEEDTNRVEDVDSRYMHYDSHVRARHRASAFRTILDESDWHVSSSNAVRQLAEDLLTVLTPLLPPEIFSHNEATHSFSLSSTVQARNSREMLLSALAKQIQLAVTLHYSIRLTGANGSVVRFCNGLRKGEKWFGDYRAPQRCVNREMMQETQFHGWLGEYACEREDALDFRTDGVAEGPNDEKAPRRPLVKMVCFPRIEMYVPQGPDAEQLAEIESEYKQHALGDMESVDEDAEDESMVIDAEDIDWNDLEEWVEEGNATHEYLNGRDSVWEKAPALVKKQHEDRVGKWPEDAGDLRLPYIQQYSWISDNDVYLEHDYVEQTEKAFVDDYFHKHSHRILTKEERRRASLSSHLETLDKDMNKDADNESDSHSSASTSSNSQPPTPTSPTILTWKPGHSPATARTDYINKMTTLRESDLPRTNAHTGWRFGLPLPADQRLSLRDAVTQARTANLASSPAPRRLQAAASLAIQRSWNRLAQHGTWTEAGVLTLMVLLGYNGREGRMLAALRGLSDSAVLRVMGGYGATAAAAVLGAAASVLGVPKRVLEALSVAAGMGWVEARAWLAERWEDLVLAR